MYTRLHHTILRALFVLLCAVIIFSVVPKVFAQDVTGWAWSSNIGWISFNSANPAAGGGPYKVVVDNTTGAFSGWAWSSNIGWISFNSADTAVCGANAVVNLSNGTVSGFARAVAGNTGSSGGWDGCISLSGTTHSSPGTGVTYDPSTGTLLGFAWGSEVVGWIDFFAAAGVGNAGHLMVQRVDSSLANVSGTSVALDGGSSISTNPYTFINVSLGNHSVTATKLAGYVVSSAGICSYPIGGTECSVVFNTSVTDTGTLYRLSNLLVEAGRVRKVVFKYDLLVPSSSLLAKGADDPDFTASPGAINVGSTVDLRWSSENVSYCEASNDHGLAFWTGSKAVSGTYTVPSPALTDTAGYFFHLDCDDLRSPPQPLPRRTVFVPVSQLSCSFQPPNSPTSPVVGKPVTLKVNVAGGTGPYSIRWIDGEGLDYTEDGQGAGDHTIVRVYSTVGFRDVIVRVTDSLGFVQSCALTAQAGPNPKIQPNFEEF